MTRSWDATTYHRVSAPQLEWAGKVLERLPLRGDETVLDAGCGSGRVTQLLLDRLPHGRVVAVDSSESMVAHAREALDPARTTVIQADLAAQTVSWDGGEASFEIDPETKRRLLEGLDDIGVTLQMADAIDRYEAERERSGPVTTTLA